jgi:hypothetical protein
MKTYRKIITLKAFINKLLRNPQKIKVVKLSSNITTVKNTYKNKELIEVFGNFNDTVLKPIKNIKVG